MRQVGTCVWSASCSFPRRQSDMAKHPNEVAVAYAVASVGLPNVHVGVFK